MLGVPDGKRVRPAKPRPRTAALGPVFGADVEAFEEQVGVRAGGRRAYMPTLLCYDACMSRQMTIRGVSEEVGQRLESLSRSRGLSVNATVLAILESAVGFDERRQRLARYATWTQEELEEFNEALSAQRSIDDPLWR